MKRYLFVDILDLRLSNIRISYSCHTRCNDYKQTNYNCNLHDNLVDKNHNERNCRLYFLTNVARSSLDVRSISHFTLSHTFSRLLIFENLFCQEMLALTSHKMIISSLSFVVLNALVVSIVLIIRHARNIIKIRVSKNSQTIIFEIVKSIFHFRRRRAWLSWEWIIESVL